MLLLHVTCLHSLALLHKAYLFFIKFGLLSQLFNLDIKLLPLIIIAQFSWILLSYFLLFGQLLLQLLCHRLFLLDNEFYLCAFLCDWRAALTTTALQLVNFIFIHFDLFIGVGKLFVEHLQTLLPLENTFTFFWTILLWLAIKTLLDRTLDFQQLGLKLAVF